MKTELLLPRLQNKYLCRGHDHNSLVPYSTIPIEKDMAIALEGGRPICQKCIDYEGKEGYVPPGDKGYRAYRGLEVFSV